MLGLYTAAAQNCLLKDINWRWYIVLLYRNTLVSVGVHENPELQYISACGIAIYVHHCAYENLYADISLQPNCQVLCVLLCLHFDILLQSLNVTSVTL